MESGPILLSEPSGQQIWKEVVEEGKGFAQPLLRHHLRPQKLNSTCGVATAAAVLSIRGEAVTEEDLLNNPAFGVVVDPTLVAQGNMGMYLDMLHRVLTAFGCVNRLLYASSTCEAEFRRITLAALTSGRAAIIVNCFFPDLGFPERLYGHFCPVAAFHEPSDCLLMLDTRPPCSSAWVSLSVVFEAMRDEDSVTLRSRGFLVAATTAENDLLEEKKKQSDVNLR